MSMLLVMLFFILLVMFQNTPSQLVVSWATTV